MAIDLSEAQRRINAIVGQSVSITEGDTDWNLRRSYLNRAQLNWSERFDWPQLFTRTTTVTSLDSAATVGLPANFRKIAEAPLIGADRYPQVDPQEIGRFSSVDKYFYILGDPSNGYSMIFNPGTLASGTSVSFSYYKTPASLVSGSDVSLCPNPDYLVQQSLYYYFQANEDGRFQDARAEAEKILANMLEFENVKGTGYHNEVLNEDETDFNFRWGRN